jgi:predicted anti-sigma-YlaC factor YlaD
MKLECKHVWTYLSDYLDQTLDATLLAEIELHLEHCEICSAILDSTRNVIVLSADERVFTIPVGFSERLHKRLQEEFPEMTAPGD